MGCGGITSQLLAENEVNSAHLCCFSRVQGWCSLGRCAVGAVGKKCHNIIESGRLEVIE